jgi:hypothetical protein
MSRLLVSDRGKNIDLGGSSSILPVDALLAQTRNEREVRRLERERKWAVKLQSRCRGISVRRRVRREMLPDVEKAVQESKDGKLGLEALRRVVLIGSEEVLSLWGRAVMPNLGGEYMFQLSWTVNNTVILGLLEQCSSGPEAKSFLVLTRQAAGMLLGLVGNNPLYGFLLIYYLDLRLTISDQPMPLIISRFSLVSCSPNHRGIQASSSYPTSWTMAFMILWKLRLRSL